MQKMNIGIDLGGTTISVGLVNSDGNIINKLTEHTDLPKTEDELENHIVSICRKLLDENSLIFSDIGLIGIGSPGTIDPQRGIVKSISNFGYENWHVTEHLTKKTDVNVRLENDANCAALGEYHFGAAKNAKSVVMLTLGTGIGGAFIIDGKVISGHTFCGGEPGHMAIELNGRPCPCGRHGCFEQYASSGALARDAERVAKENTESLLYKMYLEHDLKMNAKIPFNAMREGDKAATIVVDEFMGYLAFGISNIINFVQPEIICIGGGISKERDNLLNPLLEKLKLPEYRPLNLTDTRIVTATLGNDAAIIGAAML